MKPFRTLEASEIDVRVGNVTKNGSAILLLYKDARCDMNILDETVGALNWRREHSRDNQNCTVGIWDEEKKQWIGKEDTGTESNTEKEKGLASDSFKRACFNWGIGRELYTAPVIFIRAEDIQKDGDKITDKFTVEKIGYDDKRNIRELQILNKARKRVYSFSSHSFPQNNEPAPSPSSIVCRGCGGAIKGAKKEGRVIPAEEVSASTGGLCVACYKKGNEQEQP